MPFDFEELKIKDLILIKTKSFKDIRGYFFESYKESEFKNWGIKENFKQDNISFSVKNTLRGLHFQRKPKEQTKLVRCIKGEIFDVAVDLRKESPTFGKWVSVVLSEENKNMIYIPKGFAHGFCVLSDYAVVFYKVSEEYSRELEAGIRWNDPDLNIVWPVRDPILSDRDKNLPFLREIISIL